MKKNTQKKVFFFQKFSIIFFRYHFYAFFLFFLNINLLFIIINDNKQLCIFHLSRKYNKIIFFIKNNII